jgi:hypothetical protein
MHARKGWIGLFNFLAALVFLAACQSTATPTAEPTQPPEATQRPEATQPPQATPTPEPSQPAAGPTPTPTAPTGSFRVRLVAEESLGLDAGYYRLRLDEDGSYSTDWAPLRDQLGLVGVTGTYVVNGNQIVVTDVEGFAACTAEDEVSGTYEWSFSGNALVLIPLEDLCEARVYVLSTLPNPREE